MSGEGNHPLMRSMEAMTSQCDFDLLEARTRNGFTSVDVTRSMRRDSAQAALAAGGPPPGIDRMAEIATDVSV